MNLTFKQVCSIAKINESTGRFYRDNFLEHFEYFSTGEGRKKKYSPEASELLKNIAKFYSEGLDQEQVKHKLDEIYGAPMNNLVSQEHMSNNTITQYDVIETIRNVFQEEISKQNKHILRLEQKIDNMMDDSRTHDEKLMQAIRAIQEQKRSSFWDRFFKRSR